MMLKTNDATNEIGDRKPKNISEKDYQAFLELVDAMNTSEEEEEEEGSEREEEEGESSHGQVKVSDEDEGIGKKRRRVHFSADGGGTKAITADGKTKMMISSNGIEGKSKTILRNRDERSPICQQEIERMNKGEPSKSVLPTSKETLRDFVAERCAYPIKEMVPPHSMVGRNQRKQQRKTNKISAWKAARMGLAKNEEEEEDYS